MTQDEVDQLRIRAGSKVNAAVRAGRLPRITEETKCVDCGGQATEYEHRNYYKPLDVVPTCRRCNMKRGPAHPVADDRYEHCGKKWDGLNDGDGVEWTFTGRLAIDVDIRDIENELEKARKAPDPDLKIALSELSRLANVREYQMKRGVLRKTVAIGETLYETEYRRRWPTRKDPSSWRLHSATKYKNVMRRVGEKIFVPKP